MDASLFLRRLSKSLFAPCNDGGHLHLGVFTTATLRQYVRFIGPRNLKRQQRWSSNLRLFLQGLRRGLHVHRVSVPEGYGASLADKARLTYF